MVIPPLVRMSECGNPAGDQGVSSGLGLVAVLETAEFPD